MNYEQTRGWRNNNPLNIRRTKDKWQGRAEVQEDPEFVTFKSREWGYRAAFRVLCNYYAWMKAHGQRFCITNLISRWAPRSDGNNTEGYIKRVAEWSGIDKDRELAPPRSAEGRADIIKIMGAMTRVECGVPADKVPWEEIEQLTINK